MARFFDVSDGIEEGSDGCRDQIDHGDEGGGWGGPHCLRFFWAHGARIINRRHQRSIPNHKGSLARLTWLDWTNFFKRPWSLRPSSIRRAPTISHPRNSNCGVPPWPTWTPTSGPIGARNDEPTWQTSRAACPFFSTSGHRTRPGPKSPWIDGWMSAASSPPATDGGDRL